MMIRKLNSKDQKMVLSFLGEEPSINLFIIGDIEVFGFDSEFQELWGEFDELMQLKAVLLRFHQSYIPYAKGEFDVNGFAELIKQNNNPITLSGKQEVVERFEKFNFTPSHKQNTYFAECDSTDNLGVNELNIRIATEEDIDRIICLRDTISEFKPNPDARNILAQAMETKTGRTYYTEENEVMTACASTAAENSCSAMIVGVCTHNDYRRKGLATSVMNVLFRDILNEGKTLCLFYDNPEAGRIYKRLGFKDIGMWTMYR